MFAAPESPPATSEGMLARVATAPIELIEGIPLFSGLDRRELRAVAEALRDRVFVAGATVVQEGTSGVGFFVIESGTASVAVGGRELRTLVAGDHFGEIALIADSLRTATITADTDMACYGMTVWDFRAIVESNAPMAWKLLQTLARRLIEAERRAG
jgi:CRP/FNR family cyclic AMP-dependent transcriptional regulator